MLFFELFPGEGDQVQWLGIRESTGECAWDLLWELTPEQRGALLGQMKAFADYGWSIRVKFLKRLKTKDTPIYELRCGQQRLFFVRSGQSAVVLELVTKKDDWSKKETKRLKVAEGLAAAVLAARR